MNPTNRYCGVAAILLALCAWSARAATPSYTASVSGYTIIDAGPYSAVRQETGATRKVMPPVSTNSLTSAQANGSSSQSFTTSDYSTPVSATTHYQAAAIACYAAAQPGSVHVWAWNAAVAAPPAVLDPDGVPYLPSPYSAIASVDASAEAYDSLTIASTNLAKGTPVQFNWRMYAQGRASESGYNPSANVYNHVQQLNIRVVGTYSNKVIACDSTSYLGCFSGGDSGDGSFGLDGELSVTAKVGDVIPIYTQVRIYGDAFVDAAHSAMSSRSDWSSEGNVNMAHTAGMWFSDIPAGIQLSSASGFDYSVPPTAPATVPNAPVLSLACSPGSSQPELCWNSQTNTTYQVQYLPAIPPSGASQWTDVGPTIMGNGSTICVTDMIVPAQTQRWYRVIAFP
jgi:hypothetical protein